MRPIGVHRAHQQPESRARDDQADAAEHERGEHDDEDRTAGIDKPVIAVPPSESAPLSHGGAVTSTPIGPKMLRAACCKIRLTPQVASSVSSGRPYSRRISVTSSSAPKSAVPMNATTSPIAEARTFAEDATPRGR